MPKIKNQFMNKLIIKCVPNGFIISPITTYSYLHFNEIILSMKPNTGIFCVPRAIFFEVWIGLENIAALTGSII